MCNEKTYKWYDLEQQIIRCWDIVEDLKLLASEEAQALAIVYNTRFEKLWEEYEAALKEKFDERDKK